MSGFEFEGDDTGGPPVDVDASAPVDAGGTVDATDSADTVVSPATPEPLADLDSLDDRNDTASDRPGDELDELLYDGEQRQASLPVANGHLVATSHRLLAFAPDADEYATLRSVHRVNVTDVSLSATGLDWLVRPIAYTVLGGLAMVAGGSMVSFDAMSTTMPSSAGATGVGGLLSMIGGILSILALVDDFLRVAGALSLLVGAALMGVFVYTRGREVVVETEGEADTLRVDAGSADGAAVERFRANAGLTDDGAEQSGLFGR